MAIFICSPDVNFTGTTFTLDDINQSYTILDGTVSVHHYSPSEDSDQNGASEMESSDDDVPYEKE